MCGLVATRLAVAEPVKVVSFSPILSEVAEAVGGDAVQVIGLVKPGMDPHDYDPTPGDLGQVASARLILASGKNLEHYLGKLSSSAGADAVILKVGDHISSLKVESGHASHGHEHGASGHDSEDPHWWHSVANVAKAVKVVRDALIQVDPADRAKFEAGAETCLTKLTGLDSWVKRRVAELPRDRRELVTSHDAFQYFAKQYGFRIYAIEGVSTEHEVSAKQIDELIRTIEAEGVKAIFLEDKLNPKVSRQITRDTGATIGGTLYADGLGTGDGATYEGMVKHNVNTIVEALK
jgi:zinc/manganese transport system substrate-binding protein